MHVSLCNDLLKSANTMLSSSNNLLNVKILGFPFSLKVIEMQMKSTTFL